MQIIKTQPSLENAILHKRSSLLLYEDIEFHECETVTGL